MNIQEAFQEIERDALENIGKAKSIEELTQFRITYLGRKGKLTQILRSLGTLPKEERPIWGVKANELKKKIETLLSEKIKTIQEEIEKKRVEEEKIDISLPGYPILKGKLHPLTQVLDEIIQIFTNMGFCIAEGPDIETEYYNFDALNMPEYHPSRDMQDTFYIEENIILRTHTSPVQIRVMEKSQPPLRIIAPGKVYRCDADISHSPMFHQLEGFMVDEAYKINFAHLKGVLKVFLAELFGEEIKLRFRPSFFPFTEPSAEVDISCIMCNGEGCRVCGNSGWLEILGAGMIHPAVFKAVGYPDGKYTGFAFGMGIERIAMLKYRIDNIRLFFENNVNFLNQF